MSVSPFSAAHRSYVKSLYKRYLVNSLNWTIRRDLWRPRALEIRARFEQNRCVDTSGLLIRMAGCLWIALTVGIETCMIPEPWQRCLSRRRRSLPQRLTLILTSVSPLVYTTDFICSWSWYTAAMFPGGTKWYVKVAAWEVACSDCRDAPKGSATSQ